MDSKVCKDCGVEKPLSEYDKKKYIRKDGGINLHPWSRCKECRRAFAKIYTKTPKIAKQRTLYRLKPGWKNTQLKRLYNITHERYLQMFENQEGLCLVCSKHMLSPSASTLSPHAHNAINVDHDHNCCPGKRSCGKCVRGLLCQQCNIGLGAFKDNITFLKNAVGYLESAGIG